MVFARRTFLIAGIYGLLVLVPMYFLEGRIGRDTPPPITHPEFFYGFLGVVVAWRVAFLVISRDSVRFRPLMVPAVLEKATFAVASGALWLGGRLAAPMLAAGLIDLGLGSCSLSPTCGRPRAYENRPDVAGFGGEPGAEAPGDGR